MKTYRLSASLLFFASVASGAYAVGCSTPTASSSSTLHPLPANTGGAILKVEDAPSDVLCVEIDTSDYRTPQVRVDVTPGSSTVIPVAPLNPGTVYLWGQAYDQPCELLGGPIGIPAADAGVVEGDGGAGSSVTWEAQETAVNIVPGQYADVTLPFFQLGGANVNVTFNSCDSNGGSFYFCEDGGPPPPVADAGPPDEGPPDSGIQDASAPVPTYDAG